MEVFDFSLDEYNLCNATKLSEKRKVLRIVAIVLVIIIILTFYFAIYASSEDFVIFVLLGSIIAITLSASFASGFFLEIDYFKYKDTFYVIYEKKLYRVTMIPRVMFGGYEEISDLRRFLFLIFGEDVLYCPSNDKTSSYGPTKEIILTNFPHFVTNSNFETATIECLGLLRDCNDRGDAFIVRTDTTLVNIKKYYTNLNRLSGCITINRYFDF